MTREEYPKVIQSVLQNMTVASKTAAVLALHGDLGAGKTTFTQLLAKELGVTDSVTSPTFVIQKIYSTNDKWWTQLIHIDAYRLNDSDDLKPLRLTELWDDPANLVVIEWPERIASHIPGHAMHLRFSVINETTRRIEFIKDQ